MAHTPDLLFYSTAAQVIPVVFLALAFQVRGGFVPSLLDEDWEKYRERRKAGMRMRRSFHSGWAG